VACECRTPLGVLKAPPSRRAALHDQTKAVSMSQGLGRLQPIQVGPPDQPLPLIHLAAERRELIGCLGPHDSAPLCARLGHPRPPQSIADCVHLCPQVSKGGLGQKNGRRGVLPPGDQGAYAVQVRASMGLVMHQRRTEHRLSTSRPQFARTNYRPSRNSYTCNSRMWEGVTARRGLDDGKLAGTPRIA
jgi:hypothetical protein